MATRALVASEYPTLYRVHEVYARLILVLDSRRSERNVSMSAKLKDYWRKLPEGVNMAAILDPHQKTGPLIHQQMLTSRMDKTKLNRAHINLLKAHAKFYDIVPRVRPSNPLPSTPGKPKSAWRAFIDATNIEAGLTSLTLAEADVIDANRE